MKKILFSLLAATLLIACKNEPKQSTETEQETTAVQEIDLSAYPAALQEVFAAHGGLGTWNEMQSLTFTMPNDAGDEVHTTDLKSRDILIETDNYQIGAENSKVWLAQDSTYYPKERARFYHNLMFYFYAMPFILADDGIIYSEAPALEKDGVTYPGIKIGYESNVGDSPDDEYVLYYHPETKKMEWLSYTVTYGKDSKSTNFKFIKYNKWQEVDGVMLPEELTWYNAEGGSPTTARGAPRVFTRVDMDSADMGTSFYSKPQNGIYVDE